MSLPTTALTLRQAAELQRQGNLDGALRLCDEVLSREPRNADALNLAGAATAQDGRHMEAARLLRRAVRFAPRSPAVRVNLAVALAALGRHDGALAELDAAASLAPSLPDPHRLRGDLLRVAGDFAAAHSSYQRAVQLQPYDASLHILSGNMLAMQDRMTEALECYQRAVALERNNVEAHKQRAVALILLQRHDEALTSLDRALQLAPESADIRYTRAILLLTLGDFTRGFREHEWRWRSALTSSSLERRTYAQPEWLGQEPINGRTILLYSEQGLGDTIQFCRFVRAVAERGATVILQVQRPLLDLMREISGVSKVIADDEAPPAFDLHCSLVSLPLALDTRLETLPASPAYLHADPERTVSWRQRLSPRRAPRVGLMWNGNPDNPADRYRSFPLAEWLPHLPDGFEYYSLQRFVRSQDREALRAGRVQDLSAQQNHFSDAAALCASMDLVISVCTSIAHLSGALGRPTWILLSQHADWRWLLERDSTPWYPTARLYRQQTRGRWSQLLARVGSDLLRQFG